MHGVPAQVGRHKAPKCEREHHQRTLFCLARALPSQSMYIIAAMDRRGPPPLRKIVIGSAEQSRSVVHRVGRCERLHRRQGGPRLRASDRTGAQITQRSREMRTTIQISSANDMIAVDARVTRLMNRANAALARMFLHGGRYFIRLLPRLCLVERMKGMFLIRGLCIHTSTLRSELLYQSGMFSL